MARRKSYDEGSSVIAVRLTPTEMRRVRATGGESLRKRADGLANASGKTVRFMFEDREVARATPDNFVSSFTGHERKPQRSRAPRPCGCGG